MRQRSMFLGFLASAFVFSCSGEPGDTDVASSAATEAPWFFRGTPNGWSASSMSIIDGTTRQTICQQFSGVSNPRFKIDRFGDWRESYPSQDVVVADNTFQQIEIDTQTKQISVTQVSACGAVDEWFFRGTSNGWGTTAMVNVEGTARYELEVAFAREDPRPRFKVDRFGDWQQSYPGSDFQVSECTRYRIVFDSESFSVEAQDLGPVTSDECASAPPPPPPPPPPPGPTGADFREETIYFVLTARFYDGDPTNNYFNRDRLDPDDPHWRGDFAGLISKLDYIQELGFTALWITPPVENRSGLDYHGYHGYDFTRVDPRLESPGATYQDLIDAAHARGLKIIQDVVINHSSQYGLRGQVWIDHLPIKYYRPQGGQAIVNGPYIGNLGDYKSPFREDNDNPVAPDWFKARQTSDPEGIVPLVDPLTGVTVPSPGYNPNRFFGIDASTLDPNWYHLDGFMAGGDWENPTALQNKHLAGDTIDLATERANVQDYINQSIYRYLDMGVDAIRLDTLKHIERSEALAMVNAWKVHKPGLFVFGEALVKGLGFGSELANDNASALIRPWWYTRLTNDPGNPNGGGDSGLAVLDFPLFSTFRDNIRNGNFSGIGSALNWDWVYGDPTTLVTFF
ncbi:MAG: alpha-amylase family glycosyl hydrolase, partial [Myxococcota bacterium]